MRSMLALAVALFVFAGPFVAGAQTPTPGSGDLELKRKEQRSVVLPKQDPEQIRADADRAISDYAATRSPGQVVRETSPLRPPARPDLDQDVRGGIQTQQINRAR
jgi:hypothetical protein